MINCATTRFLLADSSERQIPVGLGANRTRTGLFTKFESSELGGCCELQYRMKYKLLFGFNISFIEFLGNSIFLLENVRPH